MDTRREIVKIDGAYKEGTSFYKRTIGGEEFVFIGYLDSWKIGEEGLCFEKGVVPAGRVLVFKTQGELLYLFETKEGFTWGSNRDVIPLEGSIIGFLTFPGGKLRTSSRETTEERALKVKRLFDAQYCRYPTLEEVELYLTVLRV